MLKKVKELKKYAKYIASKAKKSAKPLARKILSESVKLERMYENEAKKVLNKRRTTKKKSKRKTKKRR